MIGLIQRAAGCETMAPLLGLTTGLILWFASLGQINPDDLSGVGLLTILPLSMAVAYFLIIGGFCFSLRPSLVRGPLPPLFLVGLVVLLHATPVLAYGTLRYPWAWKHIGIIDFIVRHHSLDPTERYLGIYFDWPGFFIFFGLLTHLLALDPLEIAEYARFFPILMNLLTIPALVFIYRQFTSDLRIVWCAVALFLLGNWVGQDYFSPQGVAFLFYLILIALCLRYVSAGSPVVGERRGYLQRALERANNVVPRDSNVSARAKSDPWALSGFGLLTTIIIVSHQLTPLMLLAALAGLVVTTGLALRYFVIVLVAETLYLAVFANYTMTHFAGELVADVGTVTASTFGAMADLDVVSPSQQIVSIAARTLSGGLVVLAALGGLPQTTARPLGHGRHRARVGALAPGSGHELRRRDRLSRLPF